MKETQGALSMLLRRYRLILGKCRLRNALAGLLLGAVLLAPAVSPADSGGKVGRPGYPEGSHYTGTTDGASGPYTADKGARHHLQPGRGSGRQVVLRWPC